MQCWCSVCRLASFHQLIVFFFFLMIRRPPRSTQGVSSAASDVYKRQEDHVVSDKNQNLGTPFKVKNIIPQIIQHQNSACNISCKSCTCDYKPYFENASLRIHCTEGFIIC
eukprot:TRINITY_DN10621_c0_g1_i1.p2 TRINITY_DN10621_c0_g1~~TRINITY_DN10621_c0_g1_i1.p2  ORF type:complete len:111 (-),score=11.77 TRINITY_DN10621_c0_g1_i1:259-591(-)